MQFLPEIVELYMQVPGNRRLDEIVMTNGPLGPRFTLKPYTCAWPSGTNLTIDELRVFYRTNAPCDAFDSIWRYLYVAKGIRRNYSMHFVLHTSPNEELPLIGQPLPIVGSVAARIAAIEAKTSVKESIVKKHRYNTRSTVGRYASDSENDAPVQPRCRAHSEDSEWEEDSDGRPIYMHRRPREEDADSDLGEDSGEDSELDEGVKRTYPSKKERLLYFPQGLELYVQDIDGPKWAGIRLDIEVIPPFRWGPRAGLDRGKQVRFQTPKHPDGLHEHHLVAHYRKHILKEHVSSSSNGLQCIFVASGHHKDRSLADLLLNEKRKELKLAGSSIQPVQLDAEKVMARLEATAADTLNEACLSLDKNAQAALERAFDYEAKYPYGNECFEREEDLPGILPPLKSPPKGDAEESDDDMPPLISIAELTLERLTAKEAALEKERQTLNRIEGKLVDIRDLEREVGSRRILWCAEEFGSDCKESNLDKVENNYRLELAEIERLEVRLAAVRALGDQVAARRAALLKAAESM